MGEAPLVEFQDVTRRFSTAPDAAPAVDGVSLTISAGETVGIVGESGSGKSTLGRMLVGLDKPTSGRILMEGVDLLRAREPDRRAALRRVQMVFQDPYSSLNPRMTVGRQIAESLLVRGVLSAATIDGVVADLFEKVGLRPAQLSSYPHEFSGGQRQRIAIARAVVSGPQLVVADEPVSALDVSVQAQILNLLVDLQRRNGLAYLFITHDIAVVAHVSHKIVVLYRGRVVEQGLAHEIIGDARHPYTQALLDAVPRIGRRRPPGQPSGRSLFRPALGRSSVLRAVTSTHSYVSHEDG